MKDLISDLIGFALVVAASVGICVSLNLQRLVHTQNRDPETGEPRVNFTSLSTWWWAIILNTLSELVRCPRSPQTCQPPPAQRRSLSVARMI